MTCQQTDGAISVTFGSPEVRRGVERGGGGERGREGGVEVRLGGRRNTAKGSPTWSQLQREWSTSWVSGEDVVGRSGYTPAVKSRILGDRG